MSEAPPLPLVLIVDDSRIVRATLIKHLKGRFEFREEVDGEAGWAALVGEPRVQLVLSDLTMPKLDGYGFIARIRASTEARIKRLPVVLISGDEDEASRQRARDIGATDFIAKGIGSAELVSRIDSLISLNKVQEDLTESREKQIRNPVSGLFTATYVEEQAAKVYAFAMRHQQAASVVVFCIDGIDKMVQQHGGPAAAQLLQRFGQMLSDKVRKDDSLGHYGKSEYILLCPATPGKGALVFSERLREEVEASNVVIGGQRLPVSVSIGISTVPADAVADAAAWTALAGERMRHALRAGGNRIVGLDDQTQATPRLPTIEHALTILHAGRHEELKTHAGQLALAVLPLLTLANDCLKLGLPMPEIERRLKERAQ